MKLLALDPSTKATGYAVGTSATDLLEVGVVTPDRALPPIERVIDTGDTVVQMLRSMRPDAFIIEAPARQAPTIAKKSKRGLFSAGGTAERIMPQGQANYGVAVGYIVAIAKHYQWERARHGHLVAVDWVGADRWTRKRKSTRQETVAACFPQQYDPRHDPGMDASDAISLMMWWFEKRACGQVSQALG